MNFSHQHLLAFVLFASLLIIAACTTDNEEDENPQPQPIDCGIAATDTLTYSEHIQPIIAQNCLVGCHNAQDRRSGLVLETYEQVSTTARQDNKIVQSIEGTGGYSRMPPSGLEPCEIEEIKQWVNTGLQ